MHRVRPLRLLGLVFVMFFSVSGGAFSLEEVVSRVGPGLSLTLLLFVPIFWSVPETLIIGELASMLPEEGGYYRWVQRAFGPFWAFQNGYMTWLFSLVDMAIYPVLFNTYLAFFWPGIPTVARWGISLVVIWTAALINLRGAVRVGSASIVSGALVLGAFVVFTVFAWPHATHAPWHPFQHGEGSTLGAFGVGLSIALWNYMGWDNASTAAGEMDNASRIYPRALAIALPLVTLSYLVPLTAALASTDPPSAATKSKGAQSGQR
jgi:amino acid transporter